MKKALVLYYTCSNNTLMIAEGVGKVLENLNWEVKVLDLLSYSQNNNSFEPDLVILGVPVQYWEIPEIALGAIQKLPKFKNAVGFVFSTFGKCVCNTVPYHLARELQSKGVLILGGAQIVMPHSARIDTNTRIGDIEPSLGKGEPSSDNWGKLKLIIQDISKKAENRNVDEIKINGLKKLHTRGTMTNILNVIITKNMKINSMPHVQYDKEKCNQCSKCVSECDYKAIKLVNDNEITIDKKLCKKCYKCIEKCSENALNTDWDKVVSAARLMNRFAKNNETIFIA